MAETAPDTNGLVVALRQTDPIPLDVEMYCARGEVLALVGPSGAGKSTILRAIAGLNRPRSGRIVCNGQAWFDGVAGIFTPPHQRRVGLVFQSYALFPHMSALRNVEAAMGHADVASRRDRALALLDRVHLTGLSARKPGQLSGGQQQRVAVARALARDPAVLLLDEPFSAVDKATRGRLYRELADLRRSLDIPVVLVTHDFDEAARLADRMCLIDQGRVIQTGLPHDILARPASIEAAQLVDLKNFFRGVVAGHDQTSTQISWAGQTLYVMPARPDICVGTNIAWSAPSNQITLHYGDGGGSQRPRNVVNGLITEIAWLSEATSISVEIRPGEASTLVMTTPAHFARRTGLAPGASVAVEIRPEGIHLLTASV